MTRPGSMKQYTKSIPRLLKQALLNNWINLLLAFVPAGIVTHYVGVDPTIVFFMNFIAIIPLAGLLSYETDRIAGYNDYILTDILHATFGNAAELIVSALALTRHEIVIVQTSLLGSTVSNLLLVLSMTITSDSVGQDFAPTVTPGAPALAVGSLVVPAVFHLVSSTSDAGITGVSRGIAIILFLVYSSYLTIQLKTQKRPRGAKMPKHHALSSNASIEPEAERQTPALATLILMVLATVLLGFCAGGLVSSMDHVVTSTGISRMFLGLVLIPVVGTVGEHAKAVTAAARNKVDFRMIAAVGRTQAVLLGVPFVVVVGWCVGVSETILYSSALQATAAAVMVMGGNYLFQGLGSRASEVGLPFDAEI